MWDSPLSKLVSPLPEGRLHKRIHRSRTIAEERGIGTAHDRRWFVSAYLSGSRRRLAWRDRGPDRGHVGAHLAKSGPPPAPRSRGRRPRTRNKSSAKRHEQRARQRRLGLIDEVDSLSDHIAGHLLVEGAQRRVVRWLLLRAASVPPMFAHRYHKGIVGARCNSRSRYVDRRIDLIGDGPQRRGGGFGIRYFAHLLHAAPDTRGGEHAPISPGGQMRRNHSVERMRSTLD